jgi:hypothetical protein
VKTLAKQFFTAMGERFATQSLNEGISTQLSLAAQRMAAYLSLYANRESCDDCIVIAQSSSFDYGARTTLIFPAAERAITLRSYNASP